MSLNNFLTKSFSKISLNIKFFYIKLKYRFFGGVDFEKLIDEFEVVNFTPFIGTKNFFLSKYECDYIKLLAKDKLEKSKVHYSKNTNNNFSNFSNIRSSSSYCIDPHSDKLVFEIVKRLSNIVGLDYKLVPSVEVSLYKEGQFFAHHLDSYKKDHILNKIRNKNIFLQRVFTAICYLNTPEEGGITSFPNINKKVIPNIGNLLFFENTKRNALSRNIDSLHGGDPVFKGEKWILTTWFFNN